VCTASFAVRTGTAHWVQRNRAETSGHSACAQRTRLLAVHLVDAGAETLELPFVGHGLCA
jgi:hypothetical protein